MQVKTPGTRKTVSDSAAWGGKHLLVLAVLLLSTTVATAKQGKDKLVGELQNLDPAQSVHVIVQYKQGPRNDKLETARRKGAKFRNTLHLVRGAAYSLRADALNDLADDDDVEAVYPDRPVSAAAVGTTYAEIANSTEATNAPAAWQAGFDGTGIGVAVIDSGIFASQQDLKGKVVYSQSWVTASTNDQYGHGTHIAGILAGSGYNSGATNNGLGYRYTYKGVAPGVSLINLRVLDQNGNGRDSDVIAAIQTAIQLKSTYNIRVINLSLGRPVFDSYKDDPLCQAVEAAWKAGIVVVAAAGNYGRNDNAGNSGYATITVPGNDPYVITVGAMKDNDTPDRADDAIASYSSKGPTLFDHFVKPDLVAPGNRIVSTLAAGATLAQNAKTAVTLSEYKASGSPSTRSTAYMRLSGTSMAAPMVSGAAALLLQQDPSLTPDQVKARLMKTASKTFPAYTTATDPDTGEVYTSQYDVFTVGAGYLEIAAALANQDLTTATALSPRAAYNRWLRRVIMVPDPNSAWATSVLWGSSMPWGSSVIWGSSVVWGSNLVNSQSVLWGSSVVWGSSTLDGFSVIWGSDTNAATSVLWGSTTPNGSSVLWGSLTATAHSVLNRGEN
jgi:serine protease AprX